MNRKVTTIILICVVVVVTILVVTTYEVNAQDQNTSDIAARLEKESVPIKHAVVISRLPYKIELTLQSSSESQRLTSDDAWYMVLAQHEATFAYRWGPRLNSFLLVVENVHGDVLYSAETFLHPEDLNQVSLTPATSSVDDATTAELVRSSLELAGLSLSSLEVSSQNTTEGPRRILQLTLTAPNVQAANQSLTPFLGSFFYMLNTINTEKDTALVLCRLQLLDEQQTVLMDYVKDLESGYAQWSWTGISSESLPQPPLGAWATPRPTAIPPAYPSDSVEDTPVEVPYP